MCYPALDVLQFGKDLQSKAIRLTSCPVSSIHVVPKGQNQAQDILQRTTLQEILTDTKALVIKPRGRAVLVS